MIQKFGLQLTILSNMILIYFFVPRYPIRYEESVDFDRLPEQNLAQFRRDFPPELYHIHSYYVIKPTSSRTLAFLVKMTFKNKPVIVTFDPQGTGYKVTSMRMDLDEALLILLILIGNCIANLLLIFLLRKSDLALLSVPARIYFFYVSGFLFTLGVCYSYFTIFRSSGPHIFFFCGLLIISMAAAVILNLKTYLYNFRSLPFIHISLVISIFNFCIITESVRYFEIESTYKSFKFR